MACGKSPDLNAGELSLSQAISDIKIAVKIGDPIPSDSLNVARNRQSVQPLKSFYRSLGLGAEISCGGYGGNFGNKVGDVAQVFLKNAHGLRFRSLAKHDSLIRNDISVHQREGNTADDAGICIGNGIPGLLPEDVNVTGITGSTGAGQKPTPDTHFSNRNANLSNYKVFTHQHLGEIGETVVAAGGSEQTDIAFVPVRGCHARGIMSDVVVRVDEDLEQLYDIYKNYYAEHPFVCVSDKPVYMKQVVNTNYCFLSLQKSGRKLLITSVVDNLLKGASGQAVQNMNLMFGLPEDEGLRLKASYF